VKKLLTLQVVYWRRFAGAMTSIVHRHLNAALFRPWVRVLRSRTLQHRVVRAASTTGKTTPDARNVAFLLCPSDCEEFLEDKENSYSCFPRTASASLLVGLGPFRIEWKFLNRYRSRAEIGRNHKSKHTTAPMFAKCSFRLIPGADSLNSLRGWNTHG